MTIFDTILSDVFDRSAEARLDVEAEALAIEAAKRGEEDGTIALLYAYAPALRNAASTYRDALSKEDLRAYAVEGLLTAVQEHDPEKGSRLAGTVARVLHRILSEAAMREAAFAIPERTLQRFYSALRAADGDVQRAAEETAPAIGLARGTFLHVLALLRETDSLEARAEGTFDDQGRGAGRPASTYGEGWGESSLWERVTDAEDRVLVALAFDAVDDLEADVVRVKYGFEGESDDRTLSDDATVHALSVRDLGAEAVAEGQTVISRQKVQRTHASALGKMREALGA